MKSVCSFFLIVSLLVCSGPAFAGSDSTLTTTGKKVRIVAKSAAYGLGGGLIVGLASQAFKSKSKNIFLAGSLGLYAGIAIGLIVVTGTHSTRYDGPDTYKDLEDFQNGSLTTPEKIKSVGQEPPPPKMQLSLFSANF